MDPEAALPKAGVPDPPRSRAMGPHSTFVCLRVPFCSGAPGLLPVGSVLGDGALGERLFPRRWDGSGPMVRAASSGAQTPLEGLWTGFKV